MKENIESRVLQVPKSRMSTAVKVGMVSTMAAILTACASENPTHNRVCVDDKTVVARDDRCDERNGSRGTYVAGSGYHHWYYLPHSAGSPTYYAPGTRVSGGSYQAPAGAYLTSTGKVAGSSVKPTSTSRGIFGSKGAGSPSAGA